MTIFKSDENAFSVNKEITPISNYLTWKRIVNRPSKCSFRPFMFETENNETADHYVSQK
jgi:hypothetical protein